MEFKKLSDVALAEATSENTNVLIEDNGEVKKVAMDQIKVPQEPQVQANWNETDEESPAFILNKPEKLGGGGYTYFAISSSGEIYKTDGVEFPSDISSGANVTRAEFEEAYKTSPIMLVPANDSLRQEMAGNNTPSLCLRYYLDYSGYPRVVYVDYSGYSTYKSVIFYDGYVF